MEEGILFEKDPEKRTATITLNRPEKLNAITTADCDRINELVRAVNEDDDVKVLIFKGAGRAFCSGGDMAGTFDHYSGKPGERRASQRIRFLTDGEHYFGRRGVWTAVATCRKATIAQIHSYCFGQGLYLVMGCDIKIAADNSTFTHPAWRYMGPISAWQLIMQVGVTKAKEMMLTGRRIGAQEAFEYGLLTKVTTLDQLEAEVAATAASIAKLPLDGIVIGKVQFELALDAMGMGQGYNDMAALHSWQTNMRLERGEFNVMREMTQKGMSGAWRSREAYFNEDNEPKTE